MDRAQQSARTLFIRPVGERSVMLAGMAPDELIAWIEKRLGDDFVLESATVGAVDRYRVELSDRELSILRLIARGRSNGQIAVELFLSLNTIKSYIRTAYRKIGVSTRPEAVLWGVRRGLDGETGDDCDDELGEMAIS